MYTDPYRSQEYKDDDSTINLQMREACEFLVEWKKYNPIIAGGALWSWAAGEPARDIDFFVRDTWLSRKKARKTFGSYGKEDALITLNKDSYGAFAKRSEISVFHTVTAGTSTVIDLILSKWSGISVLEHFDYMHCCVAFGAVEFSAAGARYYREAKLEYLSEMMKRPNDVVMGKIKKSLWGSPHAEDKLRNIIMNLNQIYHTL